MKHRTYSIGEVARLSGISVRRLRFYADQGLLPPAGRSENGYRRFTDENLVRLDLIRCLRDAGLGLDAIREVLSHQLSLADALRLRLVSLEAEIASQRRVASTLRAVLRTPEPTATDLRRFWTMTNLSRAERRSVVERFYNRVSDDLHVDPQWKRQMVDASTPELPDDPTPEQCDAWIELSGILNDPAFIANMRSNAAMFWNENVDHVAYAKASERTLAAARQAMEQGLAATSDTGSVIAREWLEKSAAVMGRAPDLDYRKWLRQIYQDHDPRAARYWELVAILRGQPPTGSPNREWAWIVAAMKYHLAD